MNIFRKRSIFQWVEDEGIQGRRDEEENAFNTILHTTWLDNQAQTLKSNTA